MKIFWAYLSYVIRHKRFVYSEGRKLGVGRWRLLVHDLSKLLPCEFIPYMRYFYGGPYPSIIEFSGDVRNMYLSAGCYREAVKAGFDAAWLHHQHANKHHWQSWILREDNGDTKALPMPWPYWLEMVADWKGAGLAVGKPDTAGWYRRQQGRQLLHPDTREKVEREMFGGMTMEEFDHFTGKGQGIA